MQRRVIVIGGGLAGLSAAATAARAGARVTLFEARTSLGGRARTREDSGFLFNEGAHALYAGRVGIEVLRGFGIEPVGKRPPAAGAYGRLRGEIGLLPGTPMEAIRSNLVGLRAKAQLGRRVARPMSLLERPTVGRSMADWIAELLSDADARLVAQMITRVALYTDELDTVAANAAVPQLVSALTAGVLYLDGGWQQLTDALVGVATRGGVEIVTDSKVSTLDELDVSDVVVFAAGGPAHAASFLGTHSDIVHEWAEQQLPVRAATLDLGLRRLPRPDRRVVFGVDEPLYMSTHTPSAALAPAGGEVVHLLRYDTDGTVGARLEMESLLDDAQPGWRCEVVAERFNRSLTVAHGRPTVPRGLVGRPGPTVPDCPGVLVAGDWVGAEGLLGDGALASGRQAGLLAVGDLAVPGGTGSA